jgi:SAM-dependent methyltransferase
MTERAATDDARSVPYDHGFYDEISPFSVAAARVVVPIVAELTRPASVVDVGCGTGAWLAGWQDHGVEDVLGLDGDYVDLDALHIDRARFQAADLERPPVIDRSFDLAMSVEVAEHLAPDAADRFVDFLTGLAPVVLFSAAPPGQGGVDHINEQWPAYWARRFAARGYRAYDIVRPRVWSEPDVAFFYAQNLLLYAADDRFADVRPAFSLIPDPEQPDLAVPVPVVHPELLAAVARQRTTVRPASLSSLLRQLPGATSRAVRRRLRDRGDGRRPSTVDG